MVKKKILFLNPPVVCVSKIQIGWYSFGHPTSLLKLIRYHQQLGNDVSFIDCMEYVGNAPALSFYKHMPVGIPSLKLERATYTLGKNLQWLEKQLQNETYPDEIWISCHLSFNNELACLAINCAHHIFPNATIFFGGTYPSLFPGDAKKSGATVFVGNVKGAERCFPDYKLFRQPYDYIVFQLAIGCKNNCNHCSNSINHWDPVKLSDNEVVEEIYRTYKRDKIDKFINIDQNVAQFSLENFLLSIIKRKMDIKLFFYGGIQPNLITKDLVRLMKQANVQGFTLPCELDDKSNKKLNKEYSEQDFYYAIDLFRNESFNLSNVHCTFPVGLNYDNPDRIMNRIEEIYSSGMIPEVAPISLLPGTIEYENHRYLIEGKSFEELNWALWPTLDSWSKIQWYSRLINDNVEDIRILNNGD
jgi:radical SAM superfamily enzyme YgiQ (UPF0313 family)